MTIASVNAVDIDSSNDVNLTNNNELKEVVTFPVGESQITSNSSSYYVNVNDGDDSNTGNSWNSSLKTFNKALNLAHDNDNIYLSAGVYSGLENTRITIDKSINVIGSDNTTFDGLYANYIFIILDNKNVTFRNVNFINAYKIERDYDLIENYEPEGVYGSALDIKNSNVTLDNCSFIYNMANFEANVYEFIYGGAVSNFGDLTILNSYFYGNAVGSALDILGHGGSIYNKGKLFLNNSTFIDSRGDTYSFGGAVYNDGYMLMNNSLITDSHCLEESKGAAIFNNANLTLLNSIIENNIIERTDFNYIYGNIFNSGKLIAIGNIFRNNTAVYKQPNSHYYGSPTIYNVGELDLSYNSFIDNVGFNGIHKDLYLNRATSVKIDKNWWQTNENPSDNNLVNFEDMHSWIILDLNPSYCSVDITDSVEIMASWKLSNGENLELRLPISNITFSTDIAGNRITSKQIFDGNASFIFNFTENRGSYEVQASVDSFTTASTIDVGKSDTFISIVLNASEIYFNERILADIFLTDENSNLTGRVNLMLNNKRYEIDIKEGHGNITLSNLAPNNYTLKVIYNGNDFYAKSSNQTTFIVKKIPTKLKIGPIDDIKANESVNMVVDLEGYKVDGMAYLYVNGVNKQPIYLNNGKTTFNLNYFSKGDYNLTVIYPENDYYMSSSDSVLFNVEISQVSINVSSRDIYAGENAIITIDVSSKNFNSNVTLSINDVNYTVYLKDETNRITIYSLTNGTYDVLVIFNGNDRFLKANASTSFKVSKQLSSLNASIEKDNLTGTVVVKTNSTKCSGSIDLYVNQRYYSTGLVKGIAKFNVEFDRGTNYIYAFYGGDTSFEPSSWNTTMGSAENFFLMANNITFFEHNEFNYTVCLYEENGMAMPNQTISIRFMNKTYEVTTDYKGMAGLLLNLNEGNYSIIAKYNNVTINSILTIKPIQFNVTVNNITYGENGGILVDFEDNLTGTAVFEFLTKYIIVTINDSKAICNLSEFDAGDYAVNIFYSNNFFNSTKVARSFTVNKANTGMDVEFNDLEVGSSGNIMVTLSDNVSGRVEFIVDGNRQSIEINNSKAILNISGLSGGYHNLTVIYLGDNNFNNASLETEFPVKILKTNLEIVVGNDARYGEELEIAVKLNETATGEVNLKIGELSKTLKVEKGNAIWKIKGIDAGIYNITASYKSDGLFFNQKNETSFEILKANSTITLFVKEVYLDENIRIYAKLSENATGKVSFSMDGYYSPRDKEISDSTSSWLISPLETGQYTIRATYGGDDNYYSSSDTYLLNISQKRSILTVKVNDATNRDNVVINVALISSNGEVINGVVNVKLADKSYKMTIRNGKGSLNLGKLSPGDYVVAVYFEGNEYYSGSSIESSFIVSDYLLESILTCNDLVKYYNNDVKFIISLTNSKNKPISGETVYVTIKGVKTNYTTDENGKVCLDIGNTIEKYNVTAEFRGSDSYYPSNAMATVEVLSTIESNDIVKLYGSGVQYFAMFRDSNGKALSSENVMFKIAGKTYKYTTLPNGIVRLNINLNPARYSIVAINPKTGESKTSTLLIYNKLMGNKDVTNYFGAKSVYKVRAYGTDGKPLKAGNVVTFKVNGKTYKVKTDKNGYATLSLKLNSKQYVITATFNGTKVSNKITVKPVLTTKITSIKKTKKTRFAAKLVNTKGKVLKGKKITFKINGKKYVAKTNKNGVAAVNIKLTLKKGTYNVYTIYGKSKVLNKIRVK